MRSKESFKLEDIMCRHTILKEGLDMSTYNFEGEIRHMMRMKVCLLVRRGWWTRRKGVERDSNCPYMNINHMPLCLQTFLN